MINSGFIENQHYRPIEGDRFTSAHCVFRAIVKHSSADIQRKIKLFDVV